jgi:hypothetical protein
MPGNRAFRISVLLAFRSRRSRPLASLTACPQIVRWAAKPARFAGISCSERSERLAACMGKE